MIPINRKILFLLGITVFALIAYLIAWSSLFTVTKVVVTGTEQSSIGKLSGVTIGEKLARVEPRAVGRKLQEEIWIERVKLSRNWINGTVTIEVAPRIPIGIFAGRFIDKDGTIFDIPGGFSQSLPVVEANSTEFGLSAVELFSEFPQTFRSKVITISAKNEDAFEVNLKEDSRKITLIWGSDSDLNLKIKVYEALVLLKENSKISIIDVSAPHAPIVR